MGTWPSLSCMCTLSPHPVLCSHRKPCDHPPLPSVALRQGQTLNFGWSCMGPVWKKKGPWLVPPRDLLPNLAALWDVPQGGVSGHHWTVLGAQEAVPSCSPPQLWGKAPHPLSPLSSAAISSPWAIFEPH